jgi:hypothetical protein
MRMLAVILVILGVVALLVPSITFFTQERVADFGFFHIDVQKPHTIVLNPVVGIIALLVGVLMLFAARGRNTVV